MREFRLYIDESGDHTYRNLDDLGTRYLGLTGVLIRKKAYEERIQPALENLKREHFEYDVDRPPVLVRSQIIYRKGYFAIFQDSDRRLAWEDDILEFYTSLRGDVQVFTVVMDKKTHKERFPIQTFDPYAYCLAVLLWRIRGFFFARGSGEADVLAESRGKREDAQLMKAYSVIYTYGSQRFGSADAYRVAFPDKDITFRKKNQNIGGLQIADLLAYPQKMETVIQAGRPYARELSAFTNRLNSVASHMVNRYGQYLLD